MSCFPDCAVSGSAAGDEEQPRCLLETTSSISLRLAVAESFSPCQSRVLVCLLCRPLRASPCGIGARGRRAATAENGYWQEKRLIIHSFWNMILRLLVLWWLCLACYAKPCHSGSEGGILFCSILQSDLRLVTSTQTKFSISTFCAWRTVS